MVTEREREREKIWFPHLSFRVNLHLLSSDFRELRFVLVLPVAPVVVVHNATEALLLHRNPQPHPQQAGPK